MNKMETPNDLTEEMEKLRSKVSALEEKNRWALWFMAIEKIRYLHIFIKIYSK